MGPSDRWNSVSCQLPDSCPRPGNNSPARPAANPTQYRRPRETRKPLPRPGMPPLPSRSGMGSMNGLATDRFAAAGSAAVDFPGMRRAAAMRREGILSGRTSGACGPCPSAGKDNAGSWPWTTTAPALLVLAPRGAQIFFLPAARGGAAGMTRAGSGNVRQAWWQGRFSGKIRRPSA